MDDARKLGIPNRSRVRLAALGRPQSLARNCRGAGRLDRQDAATVDAAFGSNRLSAFGPNQLSASAAEIPPATPLPLRGLAGRFGGYVSRTAPPLASLDPPRHPLRYPPGPSSRPDP